MTRLIGTLAAVLTNRPPHRAARPAHRRTRLGLESLETRDVTTTGFGLASALAPYGISPGLAGALQQGYYSAAAQPSILDVRSNPAAQRQAYLNLLNNQYSPGYVLNPAGYRADLVTLGGYVPINNATGISSTATRIINDPLISGATGQLGYNTATNYFTDAYGRGGATNLNGVGVAGSVGFGQYAPGTLANLYLAQGVGGLGGARAAGTGTGSPFVDSFGAPIGTLPQDRFTYAGGPSYVSPAVLPNGLPVGYRTQDGPFYPGQFVSTLSSPYAYGYYYY
jgi:hypothetical protein